MEIKFLTLIYEFVARVSGIKKLNKNRFLVQKFNYLTRLSNHVALRSFDSYNWNDTWSHVIGASSDNTNS